jgi:hypothetical protein
VSNERRKYYRTSLVLPIEIYSYACEHGRFYELTETTNVSPLGASFRLQNRVDVDDILRVVLPMPLQLRLYDRESQSYQIYAQVRRVKRRTDGYVSVGVAFISKDAPDVEINQPVLDTKENAEIPDSMTFATRPLGPQGLSKIPSNPSNPSNPKPNIDAKLNSPSVSSGGLGNQSPLKTNISSSSGLGNQLPQIPQTPKPNVSSGLNSQQPLRPISASFSKVSSASNLPSLKPPVVEPVRREISVSMKHPTIAQSAVNNDRGEPRAKLRLSLSIRGLDKNGQYFVEVIQTEDVSKHGLCFMLCKHELEANSIVEIVGFQGKFHAQGEVKHINYNNVDKTYRIGIRLLGQPDNWIVK